MTAGSTFYWCLVKGTSIAAENAARNHGFNTVDVRPCKLNETIVVVTADQDTESRLVRWMAEDPIEAPFTSGSLLYYSGSTSTEVGR